MRKAIFAGSFNPFTIGHASIIERGLELFDTILIVIGINPDKNMEDADIRADIIRNIYNKEPRVNVLIWNGLIADLARREECHFLLRGIRGVSDLEYEMNMADINRRLGGLETVFLPTLSRHRYISSSMVRELEKYGVDTSEYLP